MTTPPRLEWILDDEFRVEIARLAQCDIVLEQRPAYCDRGTVWVNVYPKLNSELSLSLDEADGFPRYYFDLERAKLEMDAWAGKRKLL